MVTWDSRLVERVEKKSTSDINLISEEIILLKEVEFGNRATLTTYPY